MTRLEANRAMKEMMTLYYLEAKNAAHNRIPVGYVTSGAPVEPLHEVGAIPIYPENYAAMCGVVGQSQALEEAAEARGYSADLCSYARTDIGVMYTEGGPLFGLPKPDFLVAATNICHTVVKWFEVLAKYYDVPLFVFDMPYLHRGVTREALDFTVDQFKALEKFLSKVTGQTFDREHFLEILVKAAEASTLWKRFLATARKRPSPINSFDTFILLGPIVTLRGTDEAVDFLNKLVAEAEERVARDVASLENEKYRLLWDNLPIWYKTRVLSEIFAEYDAALVVSTYTNSWAAISLEGSIDDPYRELARAYLSPYINRNFADRIDILEGLTEEFDLDGLIFHSNRSCKSYSLGQQSIRDAVKARTGKPGLVLEADMNDPRSFNEATLRQQVETFIDQMIKK